MNMLAVIRTGGKQYLVSEGSKVKVEKLEAEVGSVLILKCSLPGMRSQ
jgi:ribosomal protein L21